MPRLLQIAHHHLSPASAVADQFVEPGYDITELLAVPQHRFDDPGVEMDFSTGVPETNPTLARP